MERTRAELATGGTPDSLIALDRETHGALWAAAGNAQLERTLDWLYVHVMRLWNYALPRIEGIPALTADHLAIVDAVQARDGATAPAPHARARRGLPALVPRRLERRPRAAPPRPRPRRSLDSHHGHDHARPSTPSAAPRSPTPTRRSPGSSTTSSRASATSSS